MENEVKYTIRKFNSIYQIGGFMDYLTITLIIIVGFLVLAYYRN